MREIEAGLRPEWRDISDRCTNYKSYWAQWKSFAVRDGVLVRCWESTDRKETAQIVVPRSKVKKSWQKCIKAHPEDILGPTRPSIRSGSAIIGCT
jgi:hypothetical protein